MVGPVLLVKGYTRRNKKGWKNFLTWQVSYAEMGYGHVEGDYQVMGRRRGSFGDSFSAVSLGR